MVGIIFLVSIKPTQFHFPAEGTIQWDLGVNLVNNNVLIVDHSYYNCPVWPL